MPPSNNTGLSAILNAVNAQRARQMTGAPQLAQALRVSNPRNRAMNSMYGPVVPGQRPGIPVPWRPAVGGPVQTSPVAPGLPAVLPGIQQGPILGARPNPLNAQDDAFSELDLGGGPQLGGRPWIGVEERRARNPKPAAPAPVSGGQSGFDSMPSQVDLQGYPTGRPRSSI